MGSTADVHPDYRPDIDGLRAIAVLAVVGYHAFPATVRGGFVGVDVFFVISGFLISSIIFRGLQRGRFSYVDFYVRRIRRIFPALLLMLLALLALGWFQFYSEEYRQLGLHSAGGIGFVENVLLWRESGYFDKRGELKPLLHLWSLGIEEQYYIVWPLILGAVWKRARSLLWAISAVMVVSFGLNVWLIRSEPDSTFYLPMTRFWELMIGSALASLAYTAPAGQVIDTSRVPVAFLRRWLTGSTFPQVLGVTGLLLLVIAMSVTDENSVFPGSLALLPTLGAAMLIAAGPASFVNRVGLASRPLVAIGLISYPLYLWHWPILSFIRMSMTADKSERAIGALISLPLAWLTYRLMEKPIRATRRPMVAGVLLLTGVAVGAASLGIYFSGGLPGRAVDNNEPAIFLKRFVTREFTLRTQYALGKCENLAVPASAREYCSSFGEPTNGTFVVWGDSDSWAWSPAFYQLAKDQNRRVVIFSHGGCPPILGLRRVDHGSATVHCDAFGTAEDVLEAIRQLKPSHVFLVGFWSLYSNATNIEISGQPAGTSPASRPEAFLAQLHNTFAALDDLAPITLIRTMPVMKNTIERGLLRKLPMEPTAAEHQAYEAAANTAIDAASAGLRNFAAFDPGSYTCVVTCTSMLDGTLLYADTQHISAQGALHFMPALQRRLVSP